MIFHAEQSYILPNWYPGKFEHHREVPHGIIVLCM
nr:FMN-binding negative transcriptional regulator [Acinetobacter bereziniae]